MRRRSGPLVTLSTDKTTLAEDGTLNPATVTATLSKTSDQPVTVTLTFSGTATGGGVDYTGSATSIVIDPLSLSGTITVAAAADALDEASETVIIDVSSVTNGSENGFQRVTITVTDDDLPPTVTLSTNKTALAENGSDNPATVTATLSGPSGMAVTITLARTGTATNGVDYSLSATSIAIPALSLTGSVTLQALQDATHDPGETIVLDIATATNAVEDGVQQVTVTITDDDPPPPTVTLSSSKASLLENGSDGPAMITATLSWVANGPVAVTLARSGTATVTADYTLGTVITVPAASLSASIPLQAVSDTAFELTETVVIDIASVANGVEDGVQQVTVTIADDDGPPTVTLSTNKSAISENGAQNPATVSATLSNATWQTVTVDLGITGTASGGGVDYTVSGVTLTILPFTTASGVTVSTVQDTTYEGNETVIFDILSVTNGSESGSQQVTVTILEDEPTPVLGGRNARLNTDGEELTWIDGNIEAGYRIYRINGGNGALDILPAGPMLPANTTVFQDPAFVDDQVNCYTVVPVNAANGLLGMSDFLCFLPGFKAGDVDINDFSIGLNQSNTASLTWRAPEFGADSINIVIAPLDGSAPTAVTLPGTAISFNRPTGGVGHCFLLVAKKAGGTDGLSDVACAFPGLSTVSGASGASGAPATLTVVAEALRTFSSRELAP